MQWYHLHLEHKLLTDVVKHVQLEHKLLTDVVKHVHLKTCYIMNSGTCILKTYIIQCINVY